MIKNPNLKRRAESLKTMEADSERVKANFRFLDDTELLIKLGCNTQRNGIVRIEKYR